MFEVSVIIPLYNAERFIARALDSCLEIGDIKEIIVVDDGHPDKARDIVKNYMLTHETIQLYTHPNNENRGAGASRNLGMSKATQKYIAFLDADDFFLPHRFEKDKEVFEIHSKADGCYNAINCFFYSPLAKKNFFEHFGGDITTVNSSANPNPKNLFKGLLGMIGHYGYFSLDGLTVKRKSLLNKGLIFNQNLAVHQDTDFIIRLSYECNVFPSEIDIPVTSRGVHEENRIVVNYQEKKVMQYTKRFMMWSSLNDWADLRNMGKREKQFIKNELASYRLLKEQGIDKKLLLNEIKKNPMIVLHPRYVELHHKYFGSQGLSCLLLKIRTLVYGGYRLFFTDFLWSRVAKKKQ